MRKKWFALTIAMTLVAMAAAGCGDNETKQKEQVAATTADPYDKLPKELTIQVYESGQVPSEEGTFIENRWTKWINENSPVKVKWVSIPLTGNGARTQKLNSLLAAGDAPDIIWEWGRNYPAELITQGAIQPLDEYIEKYSTSYKAFLESNPALKSYVTFDDGSMYAATSNRTRLSSLDTGLYIRKDWLDQLQLSMPETVEELLEVAKAFVERDPDGNGKKDTVAFSFDSRNFGMFENLFQANSGYWYSEDGKAKYGPTLDRYKNFLDTFKTMYEQGMIDKEFPTDKTFERSLQLWSSGKAGMWYGAWNSVKYNEVKQNVPAAHIVPVPAVSTEFGKNGYARTPEGIGDKMFMFNKTMKNPKAAVEFLDWMLDSGWETLKYGIEGVHYKIENGQKVPIDAEKNSKELKYAGNYILTNNYQPTVESLATPKNPDPLTQERNELLVQAYDIFTAEPFRSDFPIPSINPELAKIKADFGNELDKIRLKAVVSGDKYTSDMAMEDIRKAWSKAGGDKAEQIMQDEFVTKK
ncbi:extracellular solute-binding protein [Paenibacillus sp. J5C_2022]|uniref:extracellular solute-binding protein n=1 Tax=Paenibacillus sp. J5C2022 TaxID=2977129 RepID=UPI0021D24960|nr:extracellular solute-binding protein [Paenibacillus sp. J5C2022]MCU6711851.1 extracellular solute-binding protein [Paenibacillus sp. J5C2022]